MSENLPVEVKEIKNARTDLALRPIVTMENVIAANKELNELINANLVEDRDFGVIPGVDKPSLYQPGAEQINKWFAVRPEYEFVEKEIDHEYQSTWVKSKWTTITPKPPQEEADKLKALGMGRWRKDDDGNWFFQQRTDETGTAIGLYRYVVRCILYRRDTGEVVGEAIASCSSLESKFCDRPREAENTVLQQSQKRAFVRATRNTYGLSDRFTQDVEDLDIAKTGDTVTDKPKATAPPPPKPTGVQTINSGIEKVGEKTGTGKSGKPWTLFIVEAGGVKFSTFDIKIGATAKQFHADGLVATISYIAEEKGNKLLGIAEHKEAEPVTEEPLVSEADELEILAAECRDMLEAAGYDEIKAVNRIADAKGKGLEAVKILHHDIKELSGKKGGKK